jgi:hypothetical protein
MKVGRGKGLSEAVRHSGVRRGNCLESRSFRMVKGIIGELGERIGVQCDDRREMGELKRELVGRETHREHFGKFIDGKRAEFIELVYKVLRSDVEYLRENGVLGLFMYLRELGAPVCRKQVPDYIDQGGIGFLEKMVDVQCEQNEALDWVIDSMPGLKDEGSKLSQSSRGKIGKADCTALVDDHPYMLVKKPNKRQSFFGNTNGKSEPHNRTFNGKRTAAAANPKSPHKIDRTFTSRPLIHEQVQKIGEGLLKSVDRKLRDIVMSNRTSYNVKSGPDDPGENSKLSGLGSRKGSHTKFDDDSSGGAGLGSLGKGFLKKISKMSIGMKDPGSQTEGRAAKFESVRSGFEVKKTNLVSAEIDRLVLLELNFDRRVKDVDKVINRLV